VTRPIGTSVGRLIWVEPESSRNAANAKPRRAPSGR
jgi:hypothetical protein